MTSRPSRRPARRSLALLATAGLTAGILPALAGPAGATTDTDLEVVAEGLNSPRGMTSAQTADGRHVLYVAENGTGGEGPCMAAGDPVDVDDPDSVPQLCYGATGSITEIDLGSGEATRVVTGLPSIAGEDGIEAIGPSDVSVAPDGTLRIVIGLGDSPDARADLGTVGALFGTLVAADPVADEWDVVADIAAFEAANDPVEGDHGPDSNPHSVLALEDRTLVVDAGGNTLLSVDESGASPSYAVTLAEAFPTDRQAVAPPHYELPPGTLVPIESVPTTVVQTSDGTVLVGELPASFAPGDARLYNVDENPATPPTIEREGYSTIADVAERGDHLFVLSFIYGEFGALTRTRPDGTDQVLLQREELLLPGGLALGPQNEMYLTNNGVLPGAGQVLSFDPSLAGDPQIQAACPPDEMAGPSFDDIGGTVHEEAIACLAWWEIVRGRDASTFHPTGSTSRAQTASLLVRLLESTTRPVGATSTDFFDDDAADVHEESINRLAAAGIVRGKGGRVFAPGLNVTRAELVALAVRAYQHVSGEPLPAGPNVFNDADTSVHRIDINKAAAMGWIGGYGDGRFAPEQSISRAQSASVLARMLADLVEADLVDQQ